MGRELASTGIAVAAALAGCARAAADSAIVDLLPDKARYAPGEVVTLTARVQGDRPATASVDLSVYHLDAVVHVERKDVQVRKDDTSEVSFQWTPPAADFTGYLAVAQVDDTSITTGVDVSSSPFRYPRYGYISEFDPVLSAQERDRRVERLSREFLINAYQLYDWGWRHEKLIETAEAGAVSPVWTDLFGRQVSWGAVTGYVGTLHRFGAAAMGYVMI